MGFLDSLSKTFTAGVDRAKFEADKFQRTSRISGEINNIKSQIDTNVRQLGERALELYQQGSITAPEIASLAQIIAQLRDQQTQKEAELNEAQGETIEAWQANQPQTPSTPPAQSVPIMNEQTSTSYTPQQSTPSPVDYTSQQSYSGQYGGSVDPTYSAQASTSQAPNFTGRSYDVPVSNDISGSGLPNSSSIGGVPAVGETPYACPNCGHSIPNSAAFCPNCGSKVTQV
ncbi:MAG TPA: zinc-ribbon domain-containing protein [Herpetosiphonaceae bacterium]